MVEPPSGAAGLTVNVASPLLATGGPTIATQVAKLSPDNWKLPLQDASAVFTVIEDTVAARLNVTLSGVLRATPVAPSDGDADTTLNGVTWIIRTIFDLAEPVALPASQQALASQKATEEKKRRVFSFLLWL